METMAATILTTHGPCRFDMSNSGIANETPATRMAGHISIIPPHPANAQISQNGTSTQNGHRMRPAIAPSVISLNPVTFARAMIGVPRAPKATGAVFAISDRPEACSGLNPSPISRAAVTATGVPNPAAPSKNEPKQKAISSNCRRRSCVMPVRLCCNTLNRPASTVSWYMKITFSTIQPIGKRP